MVEGNLNKHLSTYILCIGQNGCFWRDKHSMTVSDGYGDVEEI